FRLLFEKMPLIVLPVDAPIIPKKSPFCCGVKPGEFVQVFPVTTIPVLILELSLPTPIPPLTVVLAKRAAHFGINVAPDPEPCSTVVVIGLGNVPVYPPPVTTEKVVIAPPETDSTLNLAG